MTNFVRVELENGSKASVPEAVAEKAVKAGGKIKVLKDEAALDHRGRPRAVEHKAPEPEGTDEPEGYAAQSVKDLEAEIDRRNDGRDDSAKLSKKGNKDALVDVLTADDIPQGS